MKQHDAVVVNRALPVGNSTSFLIPDLAVHELQLGEADNITTGAHPHLACNISAEAR